ncbi:MAG: hypothetical protein SWQ30_09365 [Thermodesulfobacteriota bacterium]|nr:hypothetical protein [Thermodesulfobacteriota bacterium]
MTKRIFQQLALVIPPVLLTVMNASASDVIFPDANWRKTESLYGLHENRVFLPAISDILKDSMEPYRTGHRFWDICDSQPDDLYASNRNHHNDVVSYSVQANISHSDGGFSFGRLHKYLGYGTVLLAGIAAVSSGSRSVHYGAAYAATGTALATCLTGYIEYSDRFNLEDGLLSGDNAHIMLGVLGTIGVATAVTIADSSESSHKHPGGAGGVSILLSVVSIKW